MVNGGRAGYMGMGYEEAKIFYYRYIYTGLDTNGCPLGNSKFTLLSDNLNICLWLSACQVEKIYQNQILIETNDSTTIPGMACEVLFSVYFQNTKL